MHYLAFDRTVDYAVVTVLGIDYAIVTVLAIDTAVTVLAIDDAILAVFAIYAFVAVLAIVDSAAAVVPNPVPAATQLKPIQQNIQDKLDIPQ